MGKFDLYDIDNLDYAISIASTVNIRCAELSSNLEYLAFKQIIKECVKQNKYIALDIENVDDCNIDEQFFKLKAIIDLIQNLN